MLSEKNIWVKRPGTGKIKAKHYKNILGKVASRNISTDKHLTWSDFK